MSRLAAKSQFFEELAIGETESLTKTVEVFAGVGFALLSGNDGPIHLCDVYASEIRVGRSFTSEPPAAGRISPFLGSSPS